MRRRDLGPVLALLTLFGYWAPWLTHPAAALRLNGYELSEWVTFLPGVPDALWRLSFLIPLACLAPLFGLTAARWRALSSGPPRRPSGLLALLPAALRYHAQSWGLFGLGLACSLFVFPPYPYLLTALSNSEYQWQLFVACAALLILLAGLYLPDDLKNVLQIMSATIGGGFGLWGMLKVWPVASGLLNRPWPIGLGWAVMLLGFGGLAISGWRRLFGLKA